MSTFSLTDKYKEEIDNLPKSVVKNCLIVSNSLLLSQGVNLNKAKDFVPMVTGKMTNKSSGDYKRLTRFFDQGKLDNETDQEKYNELMSYLRTLSWVILFNQKRSRRVFKKKDIQHLLLDGTKWDFGEHHFHLLTLCVVINDVAIPIWWEDLEKAGHSSETERINYLKAAMLNYKLEGMTLIADREYIGIEWFRALQGQGLYFVIRVKEGIYHDSINQGGGLNWERLKEKALKKRPGKKVSKRINLEGLELQYIILKNPRPNPDDELIFLLSNLKSPTQAAQIYELRWQIEVCFKHLKSNGLNLEKMSVHGKEKRHLMMAIAVLIYILSIREGIIEEELLKEKVLYKRDKLTGFSYRAESVFRKGFSILFRRILKTNIFKYLKHLIHQNFYYLIQIV